MSQRMSQVETSAVSQRQYTALYNVLAAGHYWHFLVFFTLVVFSGTFCVSADVTGGNHSGRDFTARVHLLVLCTGHHRS